MIPPSEHIPDERLVDLIEARLPTIERRRVGEHLAVCAVCADNLAQLSTIVALVRTEALEDAPSTVQAHAFQLLAARPRPQGRSLSRRIQAVLGMDSAARPLAFGVRAEAGARQVFFVAEGHDLDLRITPAGQLWSVEGQVLGPGGVGAVLLDNAAATWQVALNDLGEFALPAVPDGSYRLTVSLGDVEIEVTDLLVGNPV